MKNDVSSGQLLLEPMHQELLSAPPDQGARLSSKGAALISAKTLLSEPNTDTSLLEGYSQFDAEKDAPHSAEFVGNKAERYAIAAVVIDRVADSIVTNPSDVTRARFKNLPDTTDELTLNRLEMLGKHRVYHSGSALDVLEDDVTAAFHGPAQNLRHTFPGYMRVAQRFADISEQPKDAEFRFNNTTLERVVINGGNTLSIIVVGEYLPFIQRLMHENVGNPDLKTPEDRLKLARDGAQKMIFSNAAINLGHLKAIDRGEGSWRNFDISEKLEASIAKTEDGKWDIKLAPGSQRPAKPKTDLAGDTISCPALLQLEADDAASPLHRMVYATINEAFNRGLFENDAIAATVEKIAIDRANAIVAARAVNTEIPPTTAV